MSCLSVRGRLAAVGVRWDDPGDGPAGEIIQLADSLYGETGDLVGFFEPDTDLDHCPLPGDWKNRGLVEIDGDISISRPPVDPPAPVISAPAAIVANATSARGASVALGVRVHDRSDPLPGLRCTRRTHGRFAIGRTRVTCQARNAWHRTRARTLTVEVRGARSQLAALLHRARVRHHAWTATHLRRALRAANAHHRAKACGALPRGLGRDVRRVRAVLGCRR